MSLSVAMNQKVKSSSVRPTLKHKKLGQVLLTSAVLANVVVLGVNLKLSGLQSELRSKQTDESYFMDNNNTLVSEESRLQLTQVNSNLLIMIRRMADRNLTVEERNTILNNVAIMNREAAQSKVNLVTMSYLMVHDPPPGTDPNALFRGKGDAELSDLATQYAKESAEYIKNLKDEMIRLMDTISRWTRLYSALLVLSAILTLGGSIFVLRSDLTSPSN